MMDSRFIRPFLMVLGALFILGGCLYLEDQHTPLVVCRTKEGFGTTIRAETDWRVIAVVREGQGVTGVNAEKTVDGKRWRFVELPDQSAGWIEDTYLCTPPPAPIPLSVLITPTPLPTRGPLISSQPFYTPMAAPPTSTTAPD